ncbi:MAG TPA: NfeD family protein [Oligoflexia bacterium]|mgnify:CR=1 FL=1|nr:NfeD family protein [Oligoflexia bacterium]HMP26846.1 NfeD family protein [Oligoflexia bacterium]
MHWWVWVVTGIILSAVELLLPAGFVLLVFGISFLLTGIASAMGVFYASWQEWFFAGFISIILLIILKKRFFKNYNASLTAGHTDLVGEWVIIKSDLSKNTFGSGELRGTIWKVFNESSDQLIAGSKARVVRIEGLTLFV